jgi:hypothetical protein
MVDNLVVNEDQRTSWSKFKLFCQLWTDYELETLASFVVDYVTHVDEHGSVELLFFSYFFKTFRYLSGGCKKFFERWLSDQAVSSNVRSKRWKIFLVYVYGRSSSLS